MTLPHFRARRANLQRESGGAAADRSHPCAALVKAEDLISALPRCCKIKNKKHGGRAKTCLPDWFLHDAFACKPSNILCFCFILELFKVNGTLVSLRFHPQNKWSGHSHGSRSSRVFTPNRAPQSKGLKRPDSAAHYCNMHGCSPTICTRKCSDTLHSGRPAASGCAEKMCALCW